MESSSSLVSGLHELLLDLYRHPFPHVPNPPLCKKRASVALIIRVQPSYPDVAASLPADGDGLAGGDAEARLDRFFAQEWVRRGDPEALFIKRAARRGDRFTSHVAFPGGKQDAEDADDRATAVRETLEEVGIDLGRGDAVAVGNLPERIVTAEWGSVPLMVLCPFVFLLTRNDIPALQLQPAEVHSAHWVPLRALMAPSLRSYERADLSDRLTHQAGGLVRWVCRLLVGQMLFGATRLTPSESVFCTSSPAFLPPSPPAAAASLRGRAQRLLLGDHAGSSDPSRPMLLWGLTHGMATDFLDLLPNFDVADMWEWPTFSAPDVKLMISLVTRKFRQEKTSTIRLQTKPSATFIVDEGIDTFERELTPVERAIAKEHELSRAGAVGHLLHGYFRIVRRAVWLALLTRLGATAIIFVLLARRRRRLI